YIGPLLNFDHFNFLESLETVPAGGEQDDIPRPQLAALEVIAAIGVKIHAQSAASQHQDFAREVDRALHLIVDMWLNYVPGWMAHVAELLRKIARCKKMHPWFAEISTHDDSKLHSVKVHSLNHE